MYVMHVCCVCVLPVGQPHQIPGSGRPGCAELLCRAGRSPVRMVTVLSSASDWYCSAGWAPCAWWGEETGVRRGRNAPYPGSPSNSTDRVKLGPRKFSTGRRVSHNPSRAETQMDRRSWLFEGYRLSRNRRGSRRTLKRP